MRRFLVHFLPALVVFLFAFALTCLLHTVPSQLSLNSFVFVVNVGSAAGVWLLQTFARPKSHPSLKKWRGGGGGGVVFSSLARLHGNARQERVTDSSCFTNKVQGSG